MNPPSDFKHRAGLVRHLIALAIGVVVLCNGGTTRGAAKSARSDGGVRKYTSQPSQWYATTQAADVAENVLSYQSPLGAWPKNTDTAGRHYSGDAEKIHGTFDNNATMDELRFLASMYTATHDAKYRAAVEKGVDYILKAQYPTGGWPQSYPPDEKYHRYITFNDGAMVRVMQLLREVATGERFSFIDDGRKKAAQEEFDRGIDCILKCQIKVNGKLTAWCAQHDEITLEPRDARKFELASISGAESVDIVRMLMSLDHPSPQVVQSVDAAVAWFESAKLTGIRVDDVKDAEQPKGKDRVVIQDPTAPPMWARFYDIKTSKPIYVDRDSIPKDALDEIGNERRVGYRWIYYWPADLLAKEYPAWKARLQNGAVATRPT